MARRIKIYIFQSSFCLLWRTFLSHFMASRNMRRLFWNYCKSERIYIARKEIIIKSDGSIEWVHTAYIVCAMKLLLCVAFELKLSAAAWSKKLCELCHSVESKEMANNKSIPLKWQKQVLTGCLLSARTDYGRISFLRYLIYNFILYRQNSIQLKLNRRRSSTDGSGEIEWDAAKLLVC